MEIMKSFLYSFILLKGVRIIILSAFKAIESREQKAWKEWEYSILSSKSFAHGYLQELKKGT